MKTRVIFLLAWVFAFSWSAQAASYGSVKFQSSDLYVYERDGSVTVSVIGIGGTLNGFAGIAANRTNDTPASTAVYTVDYTTNSVFAFPGGRGWGYAQLLGLDSATQNFTIPIIDNSEDNAERVIFLRFYNTPRTPVSPTTCTVHILDDDNIVTLTSVTNAAYEGGSSVNTYTITRTGNLSTNLVINFARSGTAVYGTHYTLAGSGVTADSINIPASTSSATIQVTPNENALVDGNQTLTLALAGGYYYTNSNQAAYTTTIYDNEPGAWVEALGASASEDGDVGLLAFRMTGASTSPVTVNYALTGTAENGVDYVTLATNVTFAVGQTQTNLFVRGVADGNAEGAEKAVVSIQSGTGYFIHTNGYDVATVTLTDQSMIDRTKRYFRGTSTAPTYQSFVVPMDGQQGVWLDAIGGNVTNLFPWNLWTATNYHVNATNWASFSETNLAARLAHVNPIAAFGSRVTGSSLYVGQQYRFGIHAGYTANFANALAIHTWERTNSTVVYLGETLVALPYPDTAGWPAFLTNGYTLRVTNNGLTTIIGAESTYEMTRWGTPAFTSLTLTHLADSTTTNRIYEIGLAGELATGESMVMSSTNTAVKSLLYTVEFEQRPALRHIFIDQPHFAGEPLPPAYLGKTVDELLASIPAVTTTITLTNAANTYTNLDHSPELRRHPLLDQFVTDMRRDPVALAAYVQNEIEVSDAVSYNEQGNVADISLNAGGVARGALATFLERQGSPVEQCALLVYLLRQAGMPAVYVYPTNSQLQVLDSQVSGMLRVQVQGAVNNQGATYTTNRLIPANYPWVAAYDGTNWLHLFPWLKDVEVIEGLNLADYMPEQYDNGFKWLRNYALGDTNLLSLAVDGDDTPLAIYPKFLHAVLLTNAPGVSLDDIGYQFRQRRQTYARWGDFPKPWSAPTSGVALDSLSSAAITNVYSGLTNIFDTIEYELTSAENPAKKISTGALRLVDLHNRRLVAWHEKTGANTHNLILRLEAFRAGATGSTNFTSNDLLNVQQLSVALNASDYGVNVKETEKRHRALPPASAGWAQLQWNTYLGRYVSVEASSDTYLYKGDLVAFALSVGRVSPAMLEVHAQKLWSMEALLAATPSQTNNLTLDETAGLTAYLMGMSYHERNSRFLDFTDRVFKIRGNGEISMCFSKIGAKYVDDALPNSGDVYLTAPSVDVTGGSALIIGNGTLHAGSGDTDSDLAQMDWRALDVAQGSAQEHHILNTFFGQDDAISTMKLLQLSQARATNGNPGPVLLTASNYVQQGGVQYGGIALSNLTATLWDDVKDFLSADAAANYNLVYLTPGPVTNQNGTYLGAGALLWSPTWNFASLINGNLNGGFSGNPLPDNALAKANMINYRLVKAPDGSFRVVLKAPSGGYLVLAPDAYARFRTAGIISAAQNGYVRLSAWQNTWADHTRLMLGLTAGTTYENYANAVSAIQDRSWLGRTGDALAQAGTAVSDPVNAITGEFYIDTTDLSLPGPMPLSIRRNYSSHNFADNQFGYGWKLNYMPYLSVNTDGTVIYAAEPDGAVVAYEQTGTNANVWLPSTELNPHLSNRSKKGTGAVANLFLARIEKVVDGGNTYYHLFHPNGSERIFRVLTFVGAVSSTRPYLLEWYDDRGNFYAFEYGEDSGLPDYGQVRRIQSSNGNYLGFYYDVNGHVIEAYTGDGRRLGYEYDTFGDLVSVTLPDASQIQYQYEHQTLAITNGAVVTQEPYSTHLILQEIKPDGRTLQNEYDAHRRVTNQWATVGLDLTLVRNATFTYVNDFDLDSFLTDRVAGYTTVADVFSKVTRYDYTNSQITKVTDPLDQTVEQEWYADNATAPGYPRSLWKAKDKRGLWSELKYDHLGNVTNTVTWGDLGGEGTTLYATNTIAYAANNLPSLVIDAVGNRTQFVYSTNYPYLVEQTIRLANTTPVATNRLSYYDVTNTFTSGGVSYTNLALGILREEVRAFGSPDAATNVWSHDGRGFITQSISYTGTGDPAVTNSYFFNDRGELMERTDAAGRSVRLAYDPMSRPIYREVYEAGQGVPLSWEYSFYNENGEITWSDGPRYDPEDYVWRDYDGAGRKAVEIRWRSVAQTDGSGVIAAGGETLFATTQMEYDGFGNLTKVTDPRGNYVQRSYDAIGQLTNDVFYSVSGTALSTNRYGYEGGGLLSAVTNALGGVTRKFYTTSGWLARQENADGSTNGWTYYLDGRPKRSYQSNGSYQETTYDDAARRATRIFYTAGGTPLATNRTEFDRRGNVVIQIDAAGFGSTNRFDGLDRVKSWVGPKITQEVLEGAPTPPGGTALAVQQAYTNYFDAAGVVMTNVNALGEKTITIKDALGRTTRTEVRAANNTLVRESSIAYAADHHSLTVTNGSGASAIVSTAFTDNDGRNVLSLQYPAANTWHYTVSDYDLAGNLSFTGQYARTNSTVTQFTSAFYDHDGLNRLSEKTDRDGAVTTYSYDAAGNLTQQIVPGGLQWLAAYNSAGRMFTNWNASGGGSVVRANGYTYYGSGHAWAGLTATHTDARGVVRTSSYDDYLRLTINAYTGSLDEHSLTNIWKYDVRGLVTNIVEKFASTTTGPNVTLNRSYNAYGEIIREDAGFGTNGLSSAHNYDSAGRRQSLDVGQFGYTFVWRADGALTNVNTERGKTFYGYDTAGWLTNRIAESPSAFRNTKILSRDGTGRPLTVETKVGVTTMLTETLAYTGDGLIAAHTLDRAALLDERQYAYASQSRRLMSERLDIDGSTAWTNTFSFDSGATQGAGVLTRILQPGGSDWSAHMDTHLRVDAETNNVVRRLAYGRVNMQPNFGFATIGIKLDDRPVPFLSLGNSDTNWPTRWQAQIELTPGTHTLTASAVHPSKLYTNSTSVTFTNQAVDQTTLSYYSEGQLTQRVWKNGAGDTNRVQTFQWDAKGRLHRFTERDVNGDGHDWSAVYDALGRRWQTMTVPTIGNTAITSQLKTFTQAYDPHAEFLELGVYVDGRWSWKVHGPDMNGAYGGMNGLGGWDAVVTGPDAFYPLLPDARGNILGAFDPENSTTRWTDARITGYGSIAGRRPLSLGEGVSLWEAGAWRGKYPELSGLYNLGARYYDPVAGRFLSPDPLGHDSDPSLYAAFNGDAINYFDPDGRFGKNAWVGATQGDFASGNTGWGGVAGQTAAGFIPIYGQIGDARDTAAALRNMGNGGWSDGGNWVNLAAVGVAWIPGLDWVKGMDNVARQLDNVPLPHGSGNPPNLPATDNHLAVSGSQWNEHFANKYGADNVEWVGQVDSYNALRTQDSVGQAHHLNQNAAYGEVVPIGQGVSTKLEGNAFTDVGSPHYNAHASLETFWNQYRPGGGLYGDAPTNLEYTKALADSLRTAGKNEAEVRQAVGAAIQQRVDYGLLGGAPVPAIPGRINQKARVP